MKVTTWPANGDMPAVIKPYGELDSAAIEALCAEATSLVSSGISTLILDLGAVTSVDAEGCSVLVELGSFAAAAGCRIALGTPPSRVVDRSTRRELIDALGLREGA